MKTTSNYGFSGQYDNFFCFTKQCKQRDKERYQLRMEKEKLKLEERKLKNDSRKADNEKKVAETEASRAQVKMDEKMSSTMAAQASIQPPMENPPKKKNNTTMIVVAAAGLILVVGLGAVLFKNKNHGAPASHSEIGTH